MPTILVKDVTLYYELYGPERAPLLVLNNGILMNAAKSWAFQTQALSRSYRLLQYDCRGQGQSDHPQGSYTMQQHGADLAGLLDGLGFEKAHLAGISYGGEVAQAFALAYPQRIISLFLADTVSEVGLDLRIIVESWLDAARSGNGAAFFNATVPWNFSPEYVRANPALLEDAKRRYQYLDFPAVARLCECFLKSVNFTARLGEIMAPCCILYGEKDMLKGRPYAEILKAGLPQGELHVLHGAGHASCLERPEEFNSILLGFLAKQAYSS